jgi:predicted amidohydrolase YtcJ
MKNFFLTILFGTLLLAACTTTTSTPVPQRNTIIVTSTSNNGPGTLRQALQDAQPYDTIIFSPAVFPPNAPATIAVMTEMPHIQKGNLILDASDAGVILDGSQIPGDWVAGLQIVSSEANTIMGLQISNFPGPGIAVSGDAKNNVIGGDRSLGAGPHGRGNLFSQNVHGINVSTDGTTLNIITGNLLGTDAANTPALGNQIGICITEGAQGNIVGPDNIIAYNIGPGILVDGQDTRNNTITRNSIHNNGGMGIDLRGGGNMQLAAPMILDFNLSAGTINGTTCSNCTVEIFSDEQEGGATMEGGTAADNNGLFTFSKGAPFLGPNLTATTTDVDGNTSGFSLPSSGTATAVGTPTLIFYNGTILTMDADQPMAEAIAVAGNIILAVGSNDDILALQVSGTQVVDLQGKTMMPGFVDPHTHLLKDLGLSLEEAQQLALENGITTLTEMTATPDFVNTIQAFAAEGRLRVRTSLYLAYSDPCGVIQGDWYLQYPPTRNFGEMLRIGGVKMFADGSGFCGTMALSFDPPGVKGPDIPWFTPGRGELWFTQEELNRMVARIQGQGYQVGIHAIGDRAIEESQNAIAFALNAGPNTPRHRIEHNSFLRPDLLPRYGEIGIIATVFGAYPTCREISPNASTAKLYGEERQSWLENWRALLDANPGLHVAWHGDDPYIKPLNPLIDLYSLVTRKQVDEYGNVCNPPQWLASHALSTEEALRMMTVEGAYALFRDGEVGSLVPEKLADLIILSGNPLADPDGIKDLTVLATIVGGKTEYCAEGWETLCP